MTAYYNEIDPYCCRVLRKQIAAGNLPAGDVDERDVREVMPDDLRGYDQVHLFAGIGGIPLGLRRAGIPDDFNIWTGGFPCQDISNAGKRAGIGGARSGLWGEYIRLVRALRPAYILVENVAALLVRGLDRVLGDLAASGFDAEWSVLSACSLGAPHTRERLFVVAYPSGDGCADRTDPVARKPIARGYQSSSHGDALRRELAATRSGDRLPRGTAFRHQTASARFSQWDHEPRVRRVADRTADRVDRVGACGNAVAPQCAEFIGTALLRALQQARVA